MMRQRQLQKKSRNSIQKTKASERRSSSQRQVASKNSSNGVYYSFLTVVLLLCLIQVTISAVLNISKIISYKAKIVQITKTRDAAQALNEQLQDNIKNFSNATGLEAIARNNLKMSGEDEVLVIINSTKENEEAVKADKHNIIGLIKHD